MAWETNLLHIEEETAVIAMEHIFFMFWIITVFVLIELWLPYSALSSISEHGY